MHYRYNKSDYLDQESLRSRVFNHILEDILSGKYEEGQALVETKLAQEIGVSRTPVREAFRQLELDGLVTSIPNKGVVVNGISDKDIEEIFAVRSLVEGLAVRWATENINEEQRRDLEETAELMVYYTKKKDYQQLAKYDARFHSLIYDSCQRKVLRHILRSLMRYIQHARLGSLKVPKRAEQALKEHREILEAILAGKKDIAEQKMVHHVNSALENLLKEKNKTN